MRQGKRGVGACPATETGMMGGTDWKEDGMRAKWYLGGLEGHGNGRRHGWDARALQRRGQRDRRHDDAAGAIMDETDRRCNQPRQGGGEQNAVPSGHANPAQCPKSKKKVRISNAVA